MREAPALLLLAVALAGCTAADAYVEPAPPSFGEPVVERLPLRIALEFDPSVDAEILHRVGREDPLYHLRLGPATRIAFERVVSATFADVVRRAGGSQLPPWGQYDGAILVRVARASAEGPLIFGPLTVGDPATAAVKYELIFQNPDGMQERVWGVTATARGPGSAEDRMALAIRKAAAAVARDLDQQPAIRRWLERNDQEQRGRSEGAG